MIKPEQIPDEVVSASIAKLGYLISERHMRSAIASAINAWPQSWSIEENDSAVIRGVSGKFLPLKEASE